MACSRPVMLIITSNQTECRSRRLNVLFRRRYPPVSAGFKPALKFYAGVAARKGIEPVKVLPVTGSFLIIQLYHKFSSLFNFVFDLVTVQADGIPSVDILCL